MELAGLWTSLRACKGRQYAVSFFIEKLRGEEALMESRNWDEGGMLSYQELVCG